MIDNFEKIVKNNLNKLYKTLPPDLDRALPAEKRGNLFEFYAFGEECRISPDGIFLENKEQNGVIGILISLYALHADPAACILEPLTAFKDLKNSMPYAGAFSNHAETILIPGTKKIEQAKNRIMEKLDGEDASSITGGDFSFIVKPLPKIKLCYIFYLADEEFPASAKCLFSNNALSFLPIDALADTGEYTSKKIISLL